MAPLSTPEYDAIFKANLEDQRAGGQGTNATSTCLAPGMPMVMSAAAPAAETPSPENAMSLEDNEKALLVRALDKTNRNQTQAAKLLKITRDTLRAAEEIKKQIASAAARKMNCAPEDLIFRNDRVSKHHVARAPSPDWCRDAIHNATTPSSRQSSPSTRAKNVRFMVLCLPHRNNSRHTYRL